MSVISRRTAHLKNNVASNTDDYQTNPYGKHDLQAVSATRLISHGNQPGDRNIHG